LNYFRTWLVRNSGVSKKIPHVEGYIGKGQALPFAWIEIGIEIPAAGIADQGFAMLFADHAQESPVKGPRSNATVCVESKPQADGGCANRNKKGCTRENFCGVELVIPHPDDYGGVNLQI
jgi:hypothetical protein